MTESTPLLEAGAKLAAHRAALSSQDAALTALAGDVSTVKGVAGSLERETRLQNAELDALEAGVSRTGAATQRATQRAGDAARAGDAYTLRTFCMLLWPTVALLVLLLELLRHLLF